MWESVLRTTSDMSSTAPGLPEMPIWSDEFISWQKLMGERLCFLVSSENCSTWRGVTGDTVGHTKRKRRNLKPWLPWPIIVADRLACSWIPFCDAPVVVFVVVNPLLDARHLSLGTNNRFLLNAFFLVVSLESIQDISYSIVAFPYLVVNCKYLSLVLWILNAIPHRLAGVNSTRH